MEIEIISAHKRLFSVPNYEYVAVDFIKKQRSLGILSFPSLSPLKDMMSQTAFQLLIILPQILIRWDYRHVPHGDV